MTKRNIQEESQIDKNSNCGIILQKQGSIQNGNKQNIYNHNIISQNVKNQKANGHNADEKTSERNTAWHTECAYAYFCETMPSVGARTIEKLHSTYHIYEEMYVQLLKVSLKSNRYK